MCDEQTFSVCMLNYVNNIHCLACFTENLKITKKWTVTVWEESETKTFKINRGKTPLLPSGFSTAMQPSGSQCNFK